MSLRPIALALLCAAGCRVAPAPRPSPAAEQLTVRKADAFLELSCSAADAAELGRLGSGFLDAADRVSRWGTFRGKVQVQVLRDHASLEQAVGKPGHDWLRAWAYGDLVLLQSPRTWEAKAEPEAMLELLTHELTHSLMYQLLEPDDLPYGALAVLSEEPPLWFREGMASVTARQGQKRLSPDELRDWLRAHPGKNPLDPDPELVRTEKEAVYGAAHRAFERLLALGGDQAVRDVLRGMRSGARFSDAFAAATGQRAAEFERAALQSGFAAGLGARNPGSGAGGP
jgi:hypothetical protein